MGRRAQQGVDEGVAVPGALTVSLSVLAAIDNESLPPSTPTPSVTIKSTIASHASHMAAPSPGSLAAHIQFAEHLTSPRSLIPAHTKLVSACGPISHGAHERRCPRTDRWRGAGGEGSGRGVAFAGLHAPRQ